MSCCAPTRVSPRESEQRRYPHCYGALSSTQWAIPVGACVLFVALTFGLAVWRAPFVDEGWFASAADNLVRKGHLGIITALGEKGLLQRPTLLRIQTLTTGV